MARPKSATQLRRQGPKREPYDRVLIVCEGTKTEPNYLREMIAHHRLSPVNIEITGEGGSAPSSVVDHALALFKKCPDYDHVFCVFDRDGHTTFQEAVERVRRTRLSRRIDKRVVGEAHFEAITSIPCFEYWILLHFEYTTAHLKSFSDVALRLKAIAAISNYSKGEQGLFNRTRPLLEIALQNADRANREAASAGTNNPTTRVPELIRYLQDLAADKNRQTR